MSNIGMRRGGAPCLPATPSRTVALRVNLQNLQNIRHLDLQIHMPVHHVCEIHVLDAGEGDWSEAGDADAGLKGRGSGEDFVEPGERAPALGVS
jgi:hypothetical protein